MATVPIITGVGIFPSYSNDELYAFIPVCKIPISIGIMKGEVSDLFSIGNAILDTGAAISFLKLSITKPQFDDNIKTLWQQVRDAIGIKIHEDLGLIKASTGTKEKVLSPAVLLMCQLLGRNQKRTSDWFTLPCGLLHTGKEDKQTKNTEIDFTPRGMLVGLSGLLIGRKIGFSSNTGKDPLVLTRIFQSISIDCLIDKDEVKATLS